MPKKTKTVKKAKTTTTKESKLDLVTAAQFARRLDITSPAVWNAIKRGTIKIHSIIDGHKYIDWKTQSKAYEKVGKPYLRGERNPRNVALANKQENGKTKSFKYDIADARLDLEKYKAKKAKQDYLERAGRLISVEDVQRIWADIGNNLKKSLLAIPSRIGPIVAGEPNPHTCIQILKKEITRSLQNTIDKYQVEQPTKE